MSKRLLTFGAVLALYACSPERTIVVEPKDAPIEHISLDAKDDKLIPKPEIDAFIEQQAAKDKEHLFRWSTASDLMIWSALTHSSNILSVGYAIPSFDPKNLVKLDLKTKDWLEARQRILSIVFTEEKAVDKDLKTPEDVIVYGGVGMPNFDLKITQLSTIQKLRETGMIRFMEPADYQPRSDKGGKKEAQSARAPFYAFGCGDNEHAEPPVVNIIDYTATTPNSSKVSWNLVQHGLPAAWNRSATGLGRTIAYFDTGLSPEQSRMNSGFATGMSANRSVQKLVTFPTTRLQDFLGDRETPDDWCGHGTCVASIGTAPRTGLSPVGVAYRANLISVRASFDVLLNTTREWRGAADGFSLLAPRSDVQIYSMSMGGVPFWNGTILYSIYNSVMADAVMLAAGYGKVMFCAAGTTPEDWMPKNLVIFPATMSEVYAVTGVKIKYDNNNNPLPILNYIGPTACNECMYGPQVDFAVLMQKFNGSINRVMALPRLNETEPTSFGGSSGATATMSAMFAAVWSRYPNEPAARVLTHMVNHSTHGFQNRHPSVGWGLVDLDAATVDPTIPRRTF
ncbi:S8 family serine peptidase [Rudanella paleaurantiibacter]|uniref:S8 family serine peptidase n=1 Tax=Rudanella paleaurantiibacter TaxID=2614655 RepID=A0A7J5TUN0_9BACT|nr:S8/S53 family peptidase [Rudanella paleaurantiibacter]KAB7727369.1 S8 family serine peptidase [Rudanella paleaurantiibacter]